MIDPSEPTRQRIINEAIEWSAKEGDVPSGDPELHHSIGVLLANGTITLSTMLIIEDDVYGAEKHLLLGTKSSPPILAKLLYEYFLEDAPHTAPHYISRAVLPYLCLQNIRDAQLCLNTFIGLLISGETVPPHSQIEGVEIFPSLPLLNFLSLLIVACQRGASEFFNNLKRQYALSLHEVPWDDVSPKDTTLT
jgi:golgi to ER traffic protein 4